MSLRFLFLVLFLMVSISGHAYSKETQRYKPQEQFTPTNVLVYERTVDGDTFVASGRKIRVWGINAPEKGTPEFFAATLLLESFIKDEKLDCIFIEKDRYQRDVMHCQVDGLDIGSAMVQMGMAKDYKKFSGGYYSREEEEAQDKKRGIWAVNPHP